MYANDMQIYCHATPLELDNALTLVERERTSCFWLGDDNGLGVNAKETNVIILGSAHYVSSIDLISLRKISVNNTPLSHTSDLKNLGVTLNHTLESRLEPTRSQNWADYLLRIGAIFSCLHFYTKLYVI